MFIDASAIVAILAGETDAGELADRIAEASTRPAVSPLVIFEAVAALARQRVLQSGPHTESMREQRIAQMQNAVDGFLSEIGATEISVTPEIGRAALACWMRYGRASGNPARLNFGDCFAYACARDMNIGLLYKGEDFAQTDLA